MIEFVVDGVGVVRCNFGIFVDVVVEPFANLKRDATEIKSTVEMGDFQTVRESHMCAECVHMNIECKTHSRNGINKHSHNGHGRNVH